MAVNSNGRQRVNETPAGVRIVLTFTRENAVAKLRQAESGNGTVEVCAIEPRCTTRRDHSCTWDEPTLRSKDGSECVMVVIPDCTVKGF